jgi:hypothetical protein
MKDIALLVLVIIVFFAVLAIFFWFHHSTLATTPTKISWGQSRLERLNLSSILGTPGLHHISP